MKPRVIDDLDCHSVKFWIDLRLLAQSEQNIPPHFGEVSC